jgi:DNA segregation ATPase FtsK/SpoIIIE, S-DNA-T family
MAEKQKNTLKNTLKEEEKFDVVEPIENKAKKAKTKEVQKQETQHVTKDLKPGRFKSFFAFLHDERFHKISGLSLMFFGIYLAIALVSFLFTWQADQDKVVGNLFSSETLVSNWVGKIGALLSHIFIHKWFGVGSFIFAFLSFITGLKITFGIGFKNTSRLYAISLFLLLFTSLALAFVFNNDFFILGGAYGYTMITELSGLFGYAGAGVLLLFSFLVFLVIAYNISFRSTKAKEPEPNNEIKINEEAKMEESENIIAEKAANKFKVDFEESEFKIAEPIQEPIATQVEEDFEIIQNNDQTSDTEEIILSAATDDVQFTLESVEKKEEELTPAQIAEALTAQIGEYDPTLDLSSYQFPPIDLLNDYGGSKDIVVNTEELNANKDRILKTLGDYGIAIEKIKATVGPTVTLYEIVPAAGVRISKIKNLEDDIALSLSALGIRIIAPIPGKGTIGIEVPNINAEMVPMRTILASDKFQNTTMDLPIALGKTISNETFITDLAKMPHLLMAGATGQGKSVGLNAVLVSLLYKKHPSQIKFVLVDPKKVELTLFNKIERHFLAKLPDSADAIITDTKKVVHTLNSLCIEMDQRYDLLKDAEVRNLREYNAKFIARKLNPNNGHKFLPYIVLVVDEFADLIMTAGKEVETPIARLAQLARAIGIHLIIATQRPSVNIITGTIKANFPARIAFRVTSKIDSRTILDAGGADQLIGRGDMLLSTGNDLIRLQCAFVDTPEVEKICEYIGSQRSYPTAFMLPEYIDETGEGSAKMDDPSERDSFFNQAAEIIVQTQQGSASLLQRRLKLGYNRAGRIIDQLESAGVIGPFEGSKAREVLIKDMLSLEQFLKRDQNQ